MLLPPTGMSSATKTNIKYKDLPLDAQLNMEADEEAGYFQSMHASTIRPKVMLPPSTKAQLHIGTQTIRGHYPAAIHLAAAKPDPCAFIEERNKWDKTHLDSILWPPILRTVSLKTLITKSK
jgi:hypothetical protein